MDGLIEWRDGWMDGWIDDRVDGWMDRWMDGWIDDEWMDRWVDRWIIRKNTSSIVHVIPSPLCVAGFSLSLSREGVFVRGS